MRLMKLTNVKSICLAPRRLIFFFSFEHAVSFKMYISVSLGPVKLRGDFSDNRQHAENCSVHLSFYNFFCFQ
jgi:hypothetical protein